ncbi:sulfatase [Demequina aurantiaca]|uniref:sulfatase n=1 Tax=Demequina aurantiaca TaxID=676200 RepID=UPI000782E375|nr:sulfatase [Demequina aurantiaca]
MKAIMVMFDSLNRKYLPQYGADFNTLPNFQRLQDRSITFDTCYGGSMPCMPARREMHTGRYNFLHRSWSPLEPFDDSIPEMLKNNGVYTHLVTDHGHYWEDGGATYHNRFSTYEFFRGQEGDPWKGQVKDPEIPDTVNWRAGAAWRQDWINREYMQTKEQHSQYQTVEAGVEFIETNKAEDNWFVQIECFDPHEPFFSYDEHKERRPHTYDGDHFDWPDYRRVVEDEQTVNHVREEYNALLTFCDDSLGRVLDTMDANNMWEDTMLIVCTDHGLMIGERGWFGKNIQPWYDETIHTPLFIYDPRNVAAGERRESLVQTVDFGPTLLGYFGVDLTDDMRGKDLAPVIANDEPVRESGLFGMFGGHTCVTDGKVVYMRACATPQNQPLFNHTLMPMHMNTLMSVEELSKSELIDPLPFTKGAPVLKLPAGSWGSPVAFGTLLYDLETDPDELEPLRDPELELRMIRLMVDAMVANEAPESQFERMGLPLTSDAVTEEHLLIEKQWAQVQSGLQQALPAEEFPKDRLGVHTPISELFENPAVKGMLTQALPIPAGMMSRLGSMTLWQMSVMNPAMGEQALKGLDMGIQQAVAAGAAAGQPA